jgi:hypothetical protein
MSLFSSKVWWENKPGNVEEFDVGGLCVANVDNDPSGAGLVCVSLMFQDILSRHLLVPFSPRSIVCRHPLVLQTRL